MYTMNEKYLKLTKQYQEALTRICRSPGMYNRFLETAAFNFRLSFQNAVAAFAQDTGTDLLLTFDQWKMYGRVPKRYSKATLLLAIEKLVDNDYSFYFPAYEYLMDDLRDYRFYAKDLCHINDLAVNYLEERLAESFFSAETIERMVEIEKENRFLNHRKFR